MAPVCLCVSVPLSCMSALFLSRGCGRPARLGVAQSTEPIILSVGEEEEVSIADVARGVAKAMDFKGNVVVRARRHSLLSYSSC